MCWLGRLDILSDSEYLWEKKLDSLNDRLLPFLWSLFASSLSGREREKERERERERDPSWESQLRDFFQVTLHYLLLLEGVHLLNG